MNARQKLILAQDLLIHHFKEEIQSISLEADHPSLRVLFKKGTVLYIRYNDYGHYSYQIYFSQTPDDWVRFDDYDATWHVKSNPHHLHDHGQQTVKRSPMNGNPDKDILLLVDFLKKGVI